MSAEAASATGAGNVRFQQFVQTRPQGLRQWSFFLEGWWWIGLGFWYYDHFWEMPPYVVCHLYRLFEHDCWPCLSVDATVRDNEVCMTSLRTILTDTDTDNRPSSSLLVDSPSVVFDWASVEFAVSVSGTGWIITGCDMASLLLESHTFTLSLRLSNMFIIPHS